MKQNFQIFYQIKWDAGKLLNKRLFQVAKDIIMMKLVTLNPYVPDKTALTFKKLKNLRRNSIQKNFVTENFNKTKVRFHLQVME